eukprot:gene1767-14279_t
MELIYCTKGSVAAASARLRSCYGMVLSHVGGRPLRTEAELESATEEQTIVHL